ncbi:discoidin domain-containing protein [Sphingomonas sp. M1-B02]|uniref:discoidin domain-containing protein n=1 Tax=Sphingomonas sp. M1-B02 TaxID=3114300 RepID=UPI00223FCE80|nr:discoidin domain-containing protein [Sphingomonas sp. S6-11]UZK67871.1 discoidin domain-containing protein [Sphingomonas sp. S6-11]
MLGALLLAAAAAPQAIERFDTIEGWSAQASDGVSSRIASVPGQQGKALRLSYDFGRVSGYAFARKVLPVIFPENYELRFRVRGTGGVNDLQLKFVDASGENVWWYQIVNFRPGAAWQTVRVRRRDLSFAWGPKTDKVLRRTASLELVVVRGRDGGAGHVEIDELELEPLPANPPAPAAPALSDSRAMDGAVATSAPLTSRRPLVIDFGGPRELGGLVLHWAQGSAPRAYRIEGSDDRKRWRTLRTVQNGNGGEDPLPLPATEVRALRIVPEDAASLAEVTLKPVEWGANLNAFTLTAAKTAPRGAYPRGFVEQSYWTLAGADGALDSGLINEDGAIEVGKGGFSIEPFVIEGGRRFSWADVTARHSLEDGYLPLPHVEWAGPGWTLDSALVADPVSQAGRLAAQYRLTNEGATERRLTLMLALRPYQVNPAAQFLSQQGGVSPIGRIVTQGTAVTVTAPGAIDGDADVVRRLRLGRAPGRAAFGTFDSGDAIDRAPLDATSIEDPQRMASAALRYDVVLKPGESFTLPLLIGAKGEPLPAAYDGSAHSALHGAAVSYWRARLGEVDIRLPAAFGHIGDTVRSATAQMLMSRAGPMLKPGTRSYNRSWIRDGAMISDGLLRLGIDQPAIDYADWYSNYLFENGKVPCCVDFRGADPVPENDSHGQYIHLLTQLYRFTGDRSRLEAGWPKLLAAQRYMEGLRQSERTPANQIPERRMLYGLMPPSISHEGYSAKPQYSLWDDFWALRGYKDAAFAATVLGKPEAKAIAAQRDEFQTDLHAAIRAAAVHWKIDYIPGATSLGDLDATSTTMAFDPAGEADRLDPQQLRRTFERYWANFVARRDGKIAWADYTPYELRTVSAFVRLGWRKRANEALEFFLRDRRPQAWNGWAEVVGRDPREIRFIGDMPHAWVASDYIRSALDLFAYEKDDRIVLGAGLSPEMLAGEGAAIRGLRTSVGTLDFGMRTDATRLLVTLGGSARPAGGYLLPWPLSGSPGAARIDGKPARFEAKGLTIPTGAKRVEVRLR